MSLRGLQIRLLKSMRSNLPQKRWYSYPFSSSLFEERKKLSLRGAQCQNNPESMQLCITMPILSRDFRPFSPVRDHNEGPSEEWPTGESLLSETAPWGREGCRITSLTCYCFFRINPKGSHRFTHFDTMWKGFYSTLLLFSQRESKGQQQMRYTKDSNALFPPRSWFWPPKEGLPSSDWVLNFLFWKDRIFTT
jgi:hypothetical protein